MRPQLRSEESRTPKFFKRFKDPVDAGVRIDEDAVRATLAEAWERWARRCAELTPQQRSTATRCRPWDVRGLVAHLCPDRSMFDMLSAARTDEPAAVTAAARCCAASTPRRDRPHVGRPHRRTRHHRREGAHTQQRCGAFH